jgi:hypothetical protein
MANNYCESSTLIPFPSDLKTQAGLICARVESEIEASEGYVGYLASFDGDAVWIRHDETFTPDHAESLVRALVEELDLEGIFVVSWSYTCSKPRPDQFGGGAFALAKGKDTQWVDASETAQALVEQDP